MQSNEKSYQFSISALFPVYGEPNSLHRDLRPHGRAGFKHMAVRGCAVKRWGPLKN